MFCQPIFVSNFCSKSIQFKYKYQLNSNRIHQINSPLPKMHQMFIQKQHHRSEFEIKFIEVNLKWRLNAQQHQELDQWNCHLLSARLGGYLKRSALQRLPPTTPGSKRQGCRVTITPFYSHLLYLSFSLVVAQLTQNSTSICICIFETNSIMPATIQNILSPSFLYSKTSQQL